MLAKTLTWTGKGYHFFGSGGSEKLLPCRFPTVGIVQDFRQALTQHPPQSSSPWCTVRPPYGIDPIDHPKPAHG